MRKIRTKQSIKKVTSQVLPKMRVKEGARNSITIFKKMKVIRLDNLPIKSLQNITLGRENKKRAKARGAKRKS